MSRVAGRHERCPEFRSRDTRAHARAVGLRAAVTCYWCPSNSGHTRSRGQLGVGSVSGVVRDAGVCVCGGAVPSWVVGRVASPPAQPPRQTRTRDSPSRHQGAGAPGRKAHQGRRDGGTRGPGDPPGAGVLIYILPASDFHTISAVLPWITVRFLPSSPDPRNLHPCKRDKARPTLPTQADPGRTGRGLEP